VSERTAVRCTANDDDCLPIHYPTVNLAHYLDRGERWISVSICQTARDDDFLAVGAALGQAVVESDARVVLLASGGMSHRFWPLSEFERHEASAPIHVRTPEARAADERRLAWWARGDHASVIDSMDDYRPHKPEGMFGHYLMMVSALGGRGCTAPGRRFSAYENASGTGQVHVWFDRPDEGWSLRGRCPLTFRAWRFTAWFGVPTVGALLGIESITRDTFESVGIFLTCLRADASVEAWGACLSPGSRDRRRRTPSRRAHREGRGPRLRPVRSAAGGRRTTGSPSGSGR